MTIDIVTAWWEPHDGKQAKFNKIVEMINILNNILNFFNGTFLETFTATVTESGGTVTLNLEQSGGGDLTMNFSDAQSTFDCTPADTIALTTGSDTSPQANWIYILQSDKTQMTKSTSGWPTTEHIRIAYCLVPSATFVSNNGCYVNHNWNDHDMGVNNQGHMPHITDKIRSLGASYFSGIAGNGSQGYLTPTASNVEFKSTAGVIDQVHPHIFPIEDTSTGDVVLIRNWSGDAYHDITNLFDITAYTTGATIGNNKYFNLVVWGVANQTGEYHEIIINLPSGSYNTLSGAKSDLEGYNDNTIPREFSIDSGTGFLIARILIKMGTTWAVQLTTDLRGSTPQNITGGAETGATEFPDNTFEIFDETDPTKEMAFDVGTLVTTGNKRTYQAPDKDGILALTSDLPDYDADLLIGSGNITWVDCIYEGEGSTTRASSMRAEGVNNLGSATQTLVFILPKEKNRGGLSLRIKDVRILLFDADGSNKITTTRIRAMNTSGITTIFTHDPDLSTIALHTLSNVVADDVSTYNKVMVYINTTVATAFALEISAVQVECYYA